MPQSEIARIKTESAALEDKIKQFHGIQTKERFFATYLRYTVAKDARSAKASEEGREAIDEAGAIFSSYIEEPLRRGEETTEEIDLRTLLLCKGGSKEATVEFGHDGSIWAVPPEFGFAVAE